MAAPPSNSTYALIYHLVRGNIPPADFSQVLSTIFSAQDYKYALQEVSSQDLRAWVETLDQVDRLPSSLEQFDSSPSFRSSIPGVTPMSFAKGVCAF